MSILQIKLWYIWSKLVMIMTATYSDEKNHNLDAGLIDYKLKLVDSIYWFSETSTFGGIRFENDPLAGGSDVSVSVSGPSSVK